MIQGNKVTVDVIKDNKVVHTITRTMIHDFYQYNEITYVRYNGQMRTVCSSDGPTCSLLSLFKRKKFYITA